MNTTTSPAPENNGASSTPSNPHKTALPFLVLGAIGIVYGDIGTSPLYALKETFGGGHVPLNVDNILGVLSLFFWALTIIVSFKYVLLIMRADNNGEGGLIAMLALASQSVKDKPVMRRRLILIGMFGAALFYGDGVITPAVSVLSAIEGLKVLSPELEKYVIPLTLMVLAGLFAIQRHGTSDLGKTFGPLMVVWFLVLGILGLKQILINPSVLAAINPLHALRFFMEHKGIAFVALGAIVLCVTGAEALYADMGHFGKTPIRIAWYFWAMPGLLLNYFGQGALLIADPTTIKNPFYLLAPQWALLPLVILSTAATVIASQALISGVFSVTKQAIQLGFLPRLNIKHTSVRETGQIYIPFVNWSLFVFTVIAVVLFKSSSTLANAYGVAVTADMLITTVLTFFVIRYGWKLPLALCMLSTGGFFVVDMAFFTSNLLKVPDGGWFPLFIAAILFIVMLTWTNGRKLMLDRMRETSIPLKAFLDSVFISPPTRVEGTAVFLNPDQGATPSALLHNLKHNKVLHEYNLFVKVRLHEVPWIGMNKRLEIESLGHDCYEIVLNFGFKNNPDVPEALKALCQRNSLVIDDMNTSYFLSREIVVPHCDARMAMWRQKIFTGMHRNASAAADYLNLPANRVVELGSKLTL